MVCKFFAYPARALLTLLLMALLGHTPMAAERSTKLNVVATTGMIADTMREIGGDRIEVTALMGTGVDPHTYHQTRTDVVKLTNADLVVRHGLHLEAQLEGLFKDLGRRKTVVALAEAIPPAERLVDEENPQYSDPHTWMDPALWQFVITAGRDSLVKIDPAHAPEYEANATRYARKVRAMDARVKEMLSAVPQQSRVLVTAHDAFRYFGRANGYEVMGIQGISTESEASLHQVENLVNTMVKRHIRAIFIESSVPDQNIKALIEGAAAQGWKVNIGGELYSDAMGAPGTPDGTYIGMIEANARTISKALGATQ